VDNWLSLIRGLVRPYLAILIGTAVVALAIYMAVKHADPELAKTIITILTTAAAMIIGYYFGERSQRPK